MRTLRDIAADTKVSVDLVTHIVARKIRHGGVTNARKKAFLHEVAEMYRD